MQTNKIATVALIVNALVACGSPPKLSQPSGEWVDIYLSSSPVSVQKSEVKIHPVINITDKQQSKITPPVITKNKSTEKTKQVVVPENKLVKDIIISSSLTKPSPESGASETARGALASAGGLHNKSAGKDKVIHSTVSTTVKKLKLTTEPAGAKITDRKGDGNSKSGIKVDVPTRIWRIAAGSSVLKGFEEWAEKEKCSSSGGKWNIRKDTDIDYPVDYPLSFSGESFESATSQLFELYRNTANPLYVTGYPVQCLIIISDKK